MQYWENITQEEWDNLKNIDFDEEETETFKTVYFDMDGTVAEYDKYGDFLSKGYFENRPVQKNVISLAKRLQEKGYDIKILSKSYYFALEEKAKWLQRNMPFIKKEDYIFVPIAADKSNFVSNKYSVLIDDYNPNLDSWTVNGGISIKCITKINNVNPKYMSIYADHNSASNARIIDTTIQYKKEALINLIERS